ncbi:DNA-binding transcriptional regulator, LysR family [Sporobacter termitidis DSM 10068]|uniref:DNA-binding transcriptional regulator, LysR family n=1 Tax=Sporobacter termitidis DSM 10068 TaxID=1123282 RepID=A0A1M5UJC3_9FIRM|nr:LysR family transcriptional regulator [Sporobacter termitidis]SHH63067.1 DNA-binding transcriptional regulator, LysR family [Sporobacter termitidis DSM 10068]
MALYNITFQQIETFLTIAKYLNLSKAGEVLYSSQPSLSRTLKRFEDGVGMRLFTRSNQGMALTSEGASLYAVLEPLYQTIDKSIQSVKDSSTSPIKILRIIEPSSYDFTEDFSPLKEVVRAYEQRYPNVVLNEHLCDFKELRQAIEFGNADIVFTEDFGVRDLENISLRTLNSIGMYVAISGKHPLAQSDTLDIGALSSQTVFTVPTTDDQQMDIEVQLNACRHIGFTPKNVELKPNFQTVIHAISLGKGISICAKLINLGISHDIRYYPIELPVMPFVSVAWRTGKLSREARNFIDMLPSTEDLHNAYSADFR